MVLTTYIVTTFDIIIIISSLRGLHMPGSLASTPSTPAVCAGAQKRKAKDTLEADTAARAEQPQAHAATTVL